MTWVVATLIIIVILAISISITSLNFSYKKIMVNDISDLYAVKSVSGYMLTEETYGKLNTGVFTGETGNFAMDLFSELYLETYFNGIWFGFADENKNDYFGRRLEPAIGFGEGTVAVDYLGEEFKLNEEELVIILTK